MPCPVADPIKLILFANFIINVFFNMCNKYASLTAKINKKRREKSFIGLTPIFKKSEGV